jgi:RimJ/RimL family protein N-acetyltransferase
MDLPVRPVILQTARLRLRPQQGGDLADSLSLWSSPEVVRHISGKPSNREETWARLLRNVGHWALIGYGPWAVERRDTGAYIGEVGLFNLERDLEPGFDGTACIIAPDNAASIRVALKNGFREKLTTTYRDSLTLMFERPRGGQIACP